MKDLNMKCDYCTNETDDCFKVYVGKDTMCIRPSELIVKKDEHRELLLCECSSPEHQILFTWWDDDDRVYMTVHLPKQSLWRRIKDGIRYIFGHRSKYGDFDEVVLNPDDWAKMQKVSNYLRMAYEDEHKDK